MTQNAFFKPKTDSFGALTLHTKHAQAYRFVQTAPRHNPDAHHAGSTRMRIVAFLAAVALGLAGLSIADQTIFAHRTDTLTIYGDPVLDYD